MQRVFYALDDTRSAFWLQVAHTVFFTIGAVLCSLLPTALIAPSVALVMSAAGFFQMIIGGVTLRRRLGSLDAALMARRMTQFLLAGVVALTVGLLIAWSLGSFAETGFARDTVGGAAVSIVLIGLPMIVVYGGMLLAMRVPEVTGALALVQRRLGR